MVSYTIAKNTQAGFTLVELLVVISVIAILAGVSLSLFNPREQQRRAEDSIRRTNLQKYVLGLEAYANANGEYPADLASTNHIPDDVNVRNFIARIPDGEPTESTLYWYEPAADLASFAAFVSRADATTCFKYHSNWGKIEECTDPFCETSTEGCVL